MVDAKRLWRKSMTLEVFQMVYNWLSTIILLTLAVWWSRKNKTNTYVKTILLITGMIGFFNLILNL